MLGLPNQEGGKGVGQRERRIQWKLVSKFSLWDKSSEDDIESSEDDIVKFESLEPIEFGDKEETDLVFNGV